MNARELRRQRHIRMEWLVQRPPRLRGMSMKGSRAYIVFIPAWGPSEDWTPKRRIEKRRLRDRQRRVRAATWRGMRRALERGIELPTNTDLRQDLRRFHPHSG